MTGLRIERIERLDDPRVAAYCNVRDGELRRAAGLFLAEGRLTVERLLASTRYRTRSVFVTEAALRRLEGALASRPGAPPVYLAPRRVMDGVVGYAMHRGCLAAGERGAESDLATLLAAAPPRLVVLEDVSNPDNVGGVFRNALAFGAGGVVLSERCADPLYRKSIRVSMGATLRIPFARAPRWAEALDALGAGGYCRVALTASRRARPIAEVASGERLALLLGAEDAGLSTRGRRAADRLVTIPMAPGVDSLNVATASGIALYHFARPPA